MEINREKMIGFLEAATEIKIEKVIFSGQTSNSPPDFNVYIHPAPRIILLLNGEKKIKCSPNGEIKKMTLLPGQALFCVPGGWSNDQWRTTNEMVSIVFFEYMIRAIYINRQKDTPPPRGPDIFYHSSNPLRPAGNHTLEALIALAALPEEARYGANELLQALLQLTLGELISDRDKKGKHDLGKSHYTWISVQNHIRENWHLNLRREDVAQTFQLHPNHLSRLVKNHAGVSFNAFITQLKMEHAIQMLSASTFTVDEIASACGYSYTSYFIRVFRKHKGQTPLEYRAENLS